MSTPNALPMPNKLSLRMSTPLVNPDTPYSLPVAVIAIVLAYQRGFPTTALNATVAHSATQAPIAIGITDSGYIYAGDVVIGFYDAFATGERGGGIAFTDKVTTRKTIPYFFAATANTLRCVIAIAIGCHADEIPYAMYQRITTPLHPIIAVTKLTK